MPSHPPRRTSALVAAVLGLLCALPGCSGDDKKTAATDAGPAPVGKVDPPKVTPKGKPASNMSPQ